MPYHTILGHINETLSSARARARHMMMIGKSHQEKDSSVETRGGGRNRTKSRATGESRTAHISEPRREMKRGGFGQNRDDGRKR